MKKLFIALSITTGIGFLLLPGCYYDVEDRLYPKNDCDTSNITFSGTILPVLQTNGCLACHGGAATNGGNISLDTYAGVKAYADNGHLLGSINQQPGYPAMPLGGNKLNSCDILKITSWINRGSPQN
ncbi:MAG: hypothetical protein QM764_20830 [Chitinophagaceae bacterium]